MATSTSRFIKKYKHFQKSLQLYTWWEIVIFVIGILSFVTVFVTLFLPIGTGPNNFTVTEEIPSVETEEFVQTLSWALTLPIESGENPLVLNNGDEFLPSLLEAIDTATESINFMTYIWAKGSMSDQVLGHLTEQARKGVAVRIMLDSVGSGVLLPKEKFKDFTEAGGKVAVYHSLELGHLTRYHKRNHRRAIVIDGRLAYTGGIGIADTWLGNAEDKEHWRDMMFLVQGQMASRIQGAFAELWTGTTGEILSGEKFYPEIIPQTKNVYIPLSSTPSPDTYLLEKFITMSLHGAKKQIYITTPYFLPDPEMNDVLIEKAKGGVDVRIVVPNKYNDLKTVRHASQYMYEDLLKAGVKIYEYQPTFIHSKYIVLDGVWSIIGSANMDNRSRMLNAENLLGVQDRTFGEALVTVFENDEQNSKEITLNEWQKRGLGQRILEITSRKFVQQY